MLLWYSFVESNRLANYERRVMQPFADPSVGVVFLAVLALLGIGIYAVTRPKSKEPDSIIETWTFRKK